MKLDSIQQEIVTSSSKNIIVSAGAGSGKTRVLVERIKYLIESGVRPDNIVAITFTNRAADEMKARLYEVPGIGDAFIGTIHSFANKIYHNSGICYEILSQEREIEIVKSLISQYAKYLTESIYLRYIDMEKEVSLGIRDRGSILDEIPPSALQEINIFYDHTSQDDDYPLTLRSICDQRNIITFDRLLDEATKYFKSIKGKVEYLLVDELQDIGYLEYNFLRALQAENNFCVGDDWQSIYAFKGGDVRIFLTLMDNPNWTTYYLCNNYRNAKSILDIAESIIKQADNIIDKHIVAVREEKGTVTIDSRYQLKKYLEDISASRNFRDWFILVRSNKDIVEVSKVLDTMYLPYVTFKQGANTQESLDIKMAMDAAKLITVHTAKGLENKNVILYGNFPIFQKSYMKNSDERKVMYVGCTRAMDNLIILN